MDSKEQTTWFEHFKTIFYAIAIALLIKAFIFEIFEIPSGSMKDNLLIGDHILVTKYSYGFGPFSAAVPIPIKDRIFFNKPKRGDIIVFRSPKDDDDKKFYIKRLIGLPGDKVQMIDRKIYINGHPLEQSFVSYFNDDGGVKLTKLLEVTPEKYAYNVLYDDLELQTDFPNTTGVYLVPDHYYFFIGDNRNNSYDSRFKDGIGYVHELRLVGKAQCVLWNGSIFKNIIMLFQCDRYLIDLNSTK
jgi:signal peptidase I